MIQNPVLPGFHPDPSMINVDGVFYIATSTFEYYPGVKISKSIDLANWETVSFPLKDKKHIDMKGNPPSTGIWAPCLSYYEGIFYLVYTDVKSWKRIPFKDTPNYITRTDDIYGEWSDPVYINSSGFDPSLFHDDDGRKYYTNMEWDYREKNNKNFTGILLTELDRETLQPISKAIKIYEGTDLGCIEAPHIYKKDGWYYLFTAEGGTSYQHAETVARSRNIYGPYETHPNKHIITAYLDKNSPLQKTGHASLCQHTDGRWWLAFLCGRPINESLRCPLGRETGIAEVIWKEDGWPYLKDGGLVPPEYFEGYGDQKVRANIEIEDFANSVFMHEFQSLRIPAKYEIMPEGQLRLWGQESLLSIHSQNMLVVRQDCRNFETEVKVKFEPDNYRQMAGIIYRYSEENQYFLRISWNDVLKKCSVGILTFDKFDFTMTEAEDEIIVDTTKDIWLKVSVTGEKAVFSCSNDGKNYIEFEQIGDVTILSDEYATPLGFTGAFIGMQCIDLDDHTSYADFKKFTYCRK